MTFRQLISCTAVLLLVTIISCHLCLSISLMPKGSHTMSRYFFGKYLFVGSTGSAMLQQMWDGKDRTSGDTINSPRKQIRLPLRYLPRSGCWALPTTLVHRATTSNGEEGSEVEEEERSVAYKAIVDTGSPFLTAPPNTISIFQAISSQDELSFSSQEQYGSSRGGVQWRQADQIVWICDDGFILEVLNATIGVVSETLMQETGGIFAGLITKDDNRPTLLNQLGNGEFTNIRLEMAVSSPSLVLSQTSILPSPTRYSIPLFDLSPYGPDLYHYAILGKNLEFKLSNKKGVSVELNHPLVVVLDTGLTGCILHNSILKDLPKELKQNERLIGDISGIQVCMETESRECMCMKSDEEHWQLACFELPWFHSNISSNESTRPPYILAVGATMWSSVHSLTIDTISRRAQIVPSEKDRI